MSVNMYNLCYEFISLGHTDTVIIALIHLMLLLSFCATIFAFIYLVKLASRRPVQIHGKHVVVTGGSSGIGLEVACEVVKQGAHVTIIGRNQDRLDKALQDILQVVTNTQQRVQAISLDVSKNYNEIKEKIEGAEEQAGPVFMLVNCAGTALCGVLDDLTEEQIKNQLEVNCIGSILPTKAVMSSMKKQQNGHIVLVASQAAYCGIYGFSVYSASKFALRGFAEALNMEMAPYNVKVTISFPPDTDTPGFLEEQKHKPLETKLISETSGLFQPDYVAKKIVSHALEGKFSSNIGMDGFMLEHLCCGMTPMDSYFDTIIQLTVLNFLRCIGICYGFYFQKVVNSCHVKKMKEKQVEEDKKQD